MEVDFARIATDFVSVAITFGMFYYALRLMLLFRTGLLEEPWRDISSGIISLSVGIFVFTVESVLFPRGADTGLRYLGYSAFVIGGLLIFKGLRTQFNIWKHFAKEAPADEKKAEAS